MWYKSTGDWMRTPYLWEDLTMGFSMIRLDFGTIKHRIVYPFIHPNRQTRSPPIPVIVEKSKIKLSVHRGRWRTLCQVCVVCHTSTWPHWVLLVRLYAGILLVHTWYELRWYIKSKVEPMAFLWIYSSIVYMIGGLSFEGTITFQTNRASSCYFSTLAR